MNEDETARAVTRAMHQYDADRRASELRRLRKQAVWVLGGPIIVLSLLLLWMSVKA